MQRTVAPAVSSPCQLDIKAWIVSCTRCADWLWLSEVVAMGMKGVHDGWPLLCSDQLSPKAVVALKERHASGLGSVLSTVGGKGKDMRRVED